MTLYSKNNQYPTPIPHRISLSDGRTRTDSSTFTTEEIEDAGYIAAPETPTVEPWQKIHWTGTEWQVEDQNIESLKREKHLQIDSFRDAQIYSQKTVTLSTGQTIPVDIRRDKPDIQNLTNIVQKASIKLMRDQTDSIVFKAADNETYTLSPEEAVELGELVFEQIENEYKQSWTLKAQLEALTLSQEVYELEVSWGTI